MGVFTISIVLNEITGENSNTSGGDDHFSKVDETIPINPMVLLIRIEHVNGRPIEPEILTEATFRELCLYANSSYEPYAVEILIPHEICHLLTGGLPGSGSR